MIDRYECGEERLVMDLSPQGEWVMYEDAAARIAELEAERVKDHANINLKAGWIDRTMNDMALGNERIAELEGIAQFLFALLDDTDTADDIAKGDNDVYRGLARSASMKRFDVATTDGYIVKFNTRLNDKGE
jgi:hypothetical protein